LFAAIVEQRAQRAHGGWAARGVQRAQGGCERTQFVSAGPLHVADNIDTHGPEVGNGYGDLRIAILLFKRALDEALRFAEGKAGELDRPGIGEKNAAITTYG